MIYGIVGISMVGQALASGYIGKPIPRAYSKITLYGDATINNMQIKNYKYSENEVLALTMYNFLTWDTRTIFLALFNNGNLTAGNVTGLTEEILFWEINRREIGDTIFTKLATIPVTQTEFIDITAYTGKVYEYALFGLGNTQISEPIISDQISSEFYNHILIDENTNKTYVFNLNAEFGSVSTEEDMIRHESVNSKYMAYSFGKKNYETGQIAALIGDVNVYGSDLIQPKELLQELRGVITNGKRKILKTRKGDCIYVMTYAPSRQVLSDAIGSQPNVVKFNWDEIGVVE